MDMHAEHTTFDLKEFVSEQRTFSIGAFGPGSRKVGVANHILEECNEVESKPDDLSEWVDVMLLSLDAAWRSGLSASEIARRIAPGRHGEGEGDLIDCLKQGDHRVTETAIDQNGQPMSDTDNALYWIRGCANDLKSDAPDSPSTFVTMFCSACDGALANGFEPEAIARGLIAKLTRNKNRVWPDWRQFSEDQAINHER